MRVVIELDDDAEGVSVKISSAQEAGEKVGPDGVVETSLAALTSANLLMHLRHLKKTTGLRVRVS